MKRRDEFLALVVVFIIILSVTVGLLITRGKKPIAVIECDGATFTLYSSGTVSCRGTAVVRDLIGTVVVEAGDVEVRGPDWTGGMSLTTHGACANTPTPLPGK